VRKTLQIPKKHFPIVGLLALILAGAAGGSIYYYQFVVAHNPVVCGAPTTRIIILDAIIHELGGFTIRDAAYLNQTTLPSFTNQTGPMLNSTIRYTNYRVANNNTIDANPGDNITIYYHSIDASPDSRQQIQNGGGHGFFLGDLNIQKDVIHWGTGPEGNWWSVTFTAPSAGNHQFRCNNFCSAEHGLMTGSLAVCG
jgi:heme/copper-type cytochrome/quinol oxidase subunit 2